MKKHVFLVLLVGTACTTYMKELEDSNKAKEEIPQIEFSDPIEADVAINSDEYEAGEMNGKPLEGKFFYSLIGQELPLIVIVHADGALLDYTSYSPLAESLATEGYFVTSISRSPIGTGDDSIPQFYDLLQSHLIYLYDRFNDESLNTSSLPKYSEGDKLISREVMLIGHSAGGKSVFYKGKSAVNGLIGLSLKSMLGIAPKLASLVHEPDVSGIPNFVIQGNADNDNISGVPDYNSIEAIQHYLLEEIGSKVGFLENNIIQGGIERCYILKLGEHSIHNDDDTKQLTIAIADAYLKSDRQNFDQIISIQKHPLVKTQSLNILYWNNSDDIYYRAYNGGILPPDKKTATKISKGLELEEDFSQNLLGSTEATKTLHWTNVLKIEKDNAFYQEKHPPRTLKFMFNENVSLTKSYLRFNTGELYDFDVETYSDEGIDPAIRLIFSGNKEGIPSNWVQMSDLDCGKIQSAEILHCDRNIMQTYVIPLDSFTKAPTGSSIIGVEFDFTHAIGEKTVLLDNLGFMN